MRFSTTAFVAFFALMATSFVVDARSYGYYSYAGIVTAIEDLARSYPDIITLTDAQARYGLASPGSCGNTACKHYIVRLGLRSVQDDETPEVFFSGALHGNERVGPNAVTEFLIYAAETYAGVRPKNAWVTRMIETRSVYLMPTTNAKGYNDNRREENGIDPNRDFAYNMASNTPTKCMETITARAANELWREHMFQLAVTFHGGIHMILTEWGSFNHFVNGKSTLSPDDFAQNAIAGSMSAWAGRERSEGLYPHGRSSDLLYPVYGGMEDWGYAASWEPIERKCAPQTFGGYSAAKTTYNDAMFRAFNILVETAASKAPSATRFGQDSNLLKPEATEDGQLPRNMRIILNVMDLVQPYVQLVNPGSVSPAGTCAGALSFPPASADPNNIPGTLTVGRGQTISIAWEVGGSMTVDDTYLVWAPLTSDLDRLDASKPGFGLSSAGLVSAFGKFDTSNPTSSLGANSGRSTILTGFTRWAGGSTWGKSTNVNEASFLNGATISHDKTVWDRDVNEYIPAFAACATMPTTPGTYYVMIRARVDQKWGNKPNPADPNLDPQSHIVNARTKNSWTLSNNGRKIRAQINWYSVPIKVVVSETATTPPPVSTPAPVTAPAVTNCDCKGTSGQYETCGPYDTTTVCLIKHPGNANNPPPCDAPGGGTIAYSSGFNSWYTFDCVEESPPVVVTPPPAAEPTDCQCKGTSGQFETCGPYDDTTVCLIKYAAGANGTPPCEAPPGGNFGYSTNFNSWYVFGCVANRDAGAEKSNGLALVNTLVDDEVESERSDIGIIAGIAAAVVGVAAVALIVVKKRSAQSVTVAAVAGYEMSAAKEGGRASDNPRFGMVVNDL